MPFAQGISLQRLNLNDVGAQVAKRHRQRVPGNQARQIEDAHSIEWTALTGRELDAFEHGLILMQ